MREKVRSSGRRRFLAHAVRTLVGVAGWGAWERTKAGREPVVPTGHKVPKEAVAYQDTPKWGQSCRTCRYWEGKNRCRRVRGRISPAGWCMMFTKQTGTGPEGG